MDYTQFWDLDSQTTYLNHGSFGPSPREVCETRASWTAKLERQPMRFFCQETEIALGHVTEALSRFLQSRPGRFALVDNATFAMNIVAASVDLQEGDEILLTDHEYGAVRNIWQEKCRTTGARIVTAELPVPVDQDGVVESVEKAMTDATRIVVISHVTSATASILPVRRVCRLAKERGILTAIDGPHAVAMLDVQLDQLECDFYCASCHKWLCAPFGTGFLWAHPKHHRSIRCPIVSWGGSIAGRPPEWRDRTNWLGTRDPAGWLSIPSAIEFLRRVRANTFRSHAHELVCRARRRLLEMDGIGPFCTDSESDIVSMCAVELPQPTGWKPGYHGHPDPLQVELRDRFRIEIPVASWNGRRFLRVSAHLYNTPSDIDRLAQAVSQSEYLN